MSVTDPEYDGEIVTLAIRISEGVADDLPRWQPWIAGETARRVASLYRDGANHVRPTSVTQGSTRGVWEIILRDGRYAVVPWGAGRDAETDLGTDRAVALAHLEERLAALTVGEPKGQMELGL
jgi:hypothetical protein